jgi:serine/threonine protein kinase
MDPAHPNSPVAPKLAAGTLLSHYRIVETLGTGGMGIVFRAVDTRLNRSVALKIVKPGPGGGDEWRQRFIKEARAASAFSHPNVVTVHEVDSAAGTDFIVMEQRSYHCFAFSVLPKTRSGTRSLKVGISQSL